MLAFLLKIVAKVFIQCLLLTIGLWFWYQWKKWDSLKAARKLFMPKRALPIIGHSYYILKGWEGFSKLIVEKFAIESVSKGLYNICFWCGPMPLITVQKPEDIQKVLTSTCTAEKAEEYDYFKHATGNGLLTAPGYIWKVTRRHISPLFNSSNIEQLMPVFNDNSREFLADLAEHVDGKSVNVLHPAMSVALKTVCQLIFGPEIDFERKSVAFKAVMKDVEGVPLYFLKRMINPLLRVDFIFEWVYRNELKQVKYNWKQFTETPLKIAKSNRLNKQVNLPSSCSKYSSFTEEGSLTLIDIYSELQKKFPQFTDNDLNCEMSTLYGTGTDTVGLTLSSCLLVLGKYQDIQDRVYEEISAVVGPDDDVTMDHIRRMQYLDQVYKETLRWAIIVPYILRRTTEDIKLSDCTIPAGNTIVVGLVGPHMDPKIYPNPRQFDPERFSPENSANRAKNAFIPFSSGSRMCIGKTYAEHLVKTMLVHVLRRYRVSTDMDVHNLKKSLAVTYVNSEGYNVKLTPRKSN